MSRKRGEKQWALAASASTCFPISSSMQSMYSTHAFLGCNRLLIPKHATMAGENLDLTSGGTPAGPDNSRATAGRRFVGVHFVCCDVYTRVYVNRDETAYEGKCPRCAKRVTLRIGPGGTDARFFAAG
jgi:hypothetical protein